MTMVVLAVLGVMTVFYQPIAALLFPPNPVAGDNEPAAVNPP